MVEGARLESVFRGNSNVGSNPTLSARITIPELPRCGRYGRMVVTSLAFPQAEPPPDAVTTFVTLAGASLATFTVTVTGGKLAPTSRPSSRVQVSVASMQLQPEPVMPVAIRPLGSLSTRFTTDNGEVATARSPTFVTVIV